MTHDEFKELISALAPEAAAQGTRMAVDFPNGDRKLLEHLQRLRPHLSQGPMAQAHFAGRRGVSRQDQAWKSLAASILQGLRDDLMR
jgi:hypothetical protein